jgi:hypothetical protein
MLCLASNWSPIYKMSNKKLSEQEFTYALNKGRLCWNLKNIFFFYLSILKDNIKPFKILFNN